MSDLFKNARWISDKSYTWSKKQSPVPMVFRKALSLKNKVKKATLHVTALGIYEFEIDGQKVGKDWFAPGFTSYKHQIQVQTYDVTKMLKLDSVLTATVGGGWAVGSFTFDRKNRIAADRQALLAELIIQYIDGKIETIGTDPSWQVTEDGPFRMAEWYDGETYDATVDLDKANWKQADMAIPRGNPKLLPQYGPPVRVKGTIEPVSVTTAHGGELIYDFGQNFAGVISAELTGTAGQIVTFRHAELMKDGELYVESLRTAKATAAYICRNGVQFYHPRLTYMGFRYVGVRGIKAEELKLTAMILYSDIKEIGSFRCSDERLNRLQQNIQWSARSNFVDIPTDCPQRDERMGWTGDISLFASTACYNFDLSKFLDKWLRDVRAEQGVFGGIPMVVPRNGSVWPPFTTACWGDCCILVPWAEYMARGNLEMLRKSYPSMKKFLRSVKRWAGLFSVGKRRYIWRFLFQFGDWCAPLDPPEPWPKCIMTWMKRGPWIATAYYANSCGIVVKVAELLGEKDDAAQYRVLRKKIIDAYRKVFTDGHGKLKTEFQTGYVLPLAFGMADKIEAQTMANNLDRLLEQTGNKLTTGFPSTPFLLFALSDNGHLDRAYQLLMQEECPSWLYQVKVGATTIWEGWDVVNPDGSPRTSSSCNHYAYGAVGDWLYRRVLGIEATSGGYKTFNVNPMPGGGLTWAEGGTETPYGTIHVRWEYKDNDFILNIDVPEGTTCNVTLPNGKKQLCQNGHHTFSL